ncbi:DUF4163 domain-containing protein [Paenibacillus sp. sptzw28]|uniref:stalk domain-containing protein n=1 Tax=Paenibacillus sp. sptzw28 TaxID=715179 RepID=UPI001C6E9D4E|nr:stalk domain-containing protein [Paenibacillus sp. sptzw28]QYR21448.1 DUF4163 domain-containing protein [Paenibacillus sp. sptzw28]
MENKQVTHYMENSNSQKHSKQRIKHALLSAPLAAALLLGAASVPGTAAAAAVHTTHIVKQQLQLKTMKIIVDGKTLNVPTGYIDGETFVGLRFLSGHLGMTTKWDSKTGNITVSKSGKSIEMKNKSSDYMVDGLRVNGKAPMIIKSATYLPLRFLLDETGFTTGFDAKSKVITVNPAAENHLKIVKEIVKESKGNSLLSVQYAKLEDLKNADVQAKINAILKADSERYVKEGRKLISESGSKAYAKYEVNVWVTYNRNNKLSLYTKIYSDGGGAHGSYTADSHTFDLGTGKELTLKEAFGGKPDYIQIINAGIKKQIKEKSFILDAPFKTIQADQKFFLRGNSVVIYMDNTPTAEGIVEFTIPIS